MAVVAARVSATQCLLEAGRPALEILAALADVEVQLEQASRQVASLFADDLAEALPAEALHTELEQVFALLRRDEAASGQTLQESQLLQRADRD